MIASTREVTNGPFRPGSSAEVFVAFLRLGLTSFGGPIAHLGYFHRELVRRRGWVEDAQYAQLVAVSQFLPGPASSQIGFSLGLIRAGWWGGIAAFVAFTLPSALLLFAFAYLVPWLERPYGQAAIQGLKLVAVAVVAQGVLAMVERLTPDARRKAIAVVAAAAIVLSGTAGMQLIVVAAGALLGWAFCRGVTGEGASTMGVRHSARTGLLLLALFSVLLIGALVPGAADSPLTAISKALYRAGALVFGGAHVVLPLLEETVVQPGWVARDEFFAGYGAAQAVPGPMFSFATFLGARLEGAHGGAIGASVSVLAIFLPGLLLAAGVLPVWQYIASRKEALSALAGINAAVVGLLAAALYDPVWVSAVHSPIDVAIASIGFLMLASERVSVLVVLGWCVLASMMRVAG